MTNAEAESLRKAYLSIRGHLAEAEAAWDRMAGKLADLQLEPSELMPEEFFEMTASAANQAASPLCVLCLHPAAPIGTEGRAVMSALWKGRLCHVQCVNFWLENAATSDLLKELGGVDPFAEHT